ncbi:hypothetical protein LTR37_008659 [Vermiconidia calcicola]|uniref:Uncharacterized protein n=1 Tax=Vermiconidia calcicola TaxID=1690605 RepID=A0ACC3NAH8_9PEZI|nr:hypothetical protein LTR37_008659 [Vermiconidia calcicola]
MPPLSRNTGKLLSSVNGKPHATQDDHIDHLPTPPATNSTRSSSSQMALVEKDEDIYRDPESSDDEEDAATLPVKANGFKLPHQVDETHEPLKPVTFKTPQLSGSPGSAGSKRSSDADPASSNSDLEIFGSQMSNKRSKKSHGSNIHAPPRSQSGQYGKAARRLAQRAEQRTGFKSPRKDKKPEKTELAPKFKSAKGTGMFEFGASEPRPQWRASRGTSVDDECRHTRSPSLSSLSSPPSSPEVEEIRHLNLPTAQPYVARTECTICGQDVDISLKESFEDEFTQGKQLSYKWQQRFCLYHKRHEAKQLSKQKGYPEIDWNGLEKRMRRHHSRLKAVMVNKTASYYRDRLSERVKERSKTALQAMNDEDGAKHGADTGYYGPRGEKVMTDHIIAHLSDNLRQQATKDRLVASSGVLGGVSGFLQAVLVPELAEQLVREDMKLSGDDARKVVAESGELGDLLNPEVDDHVTEIVDLSE